RVASVQIAVYANKPHKNLDLLQNHAPFPVKILRQEGEWKGTLDKLIGYWSYLKMVDDDDLIVFLDAFDVFPNGFDGHELLRRFFSFGTPVVVAAEENIFPREVLEQATVAVDQMHAVGLGNARRPRQSQCQASAPSRYLNAGGIIGMGWALRKIYDDMRLNMAANNPQLLMA
ncbi:psuK, partial [Symbiodinium sp. KB8]